MAEAEHLERLKSGVKDWNEWRKANPTIRPDLRTANLVRAQLDGANLYRADLFDANFWNASLCGVNLRRASIQWANFRRANLTHSDLRKASLIGAKFRGADLRYADLTGANISQAQFVETHMEHAILNDCKVYGIAAWDVFLDETSQQSLVISKPDFPIITVDDLEVAQFVYLLLNTKKIRNVIDTIGQKAVLILGRFTPERKVVLDAISEELRKRDYLPIMFDFEKPDGRNYIETVSTLAHLAKFIIADVTDAKVILQELERVVPSLPSVPVQPIVQAGSDVNAVIIDFVGRLNFVNHIFAYNDIDDVKQSLEESVIAPAEARLAAIERERTLFLEQVRRIASQ